MPRKVARSPLLWQGGEPIAQTWQTEDSNRSVLRSRSGISADAMTPISRLPTAVHHCNDEHVVEFDSVKHRVGKHMDKTSPHVLLKRTPAIRRLGDLTKRRFDTGDEAKLKTFLTIRVKTRGILILVESLRVKLVSHRATARRTRARATSLGIVLTRPLRTSSRRRKASTAQSCRM